MIVKMTKYTLVVLASGREGVLERLQSVGLVDITSSDWSPSEADRALIAAIEAHREALDSPLLAEGASSHATPYSTGVEAMEHFVAARRELGVVETELAAEHRALADALPWGDFDPEKLRALLDAGVGEEELLPMVLPADAETSVAAQAQAAALPTRSAHQIESHIAALEAERTSWKQVLGRVAASRDKIEKDGAALADQLRFNQAHSGGTPAADDSLVVMEGWARRADEERVEAALDADPSLIYLKASPTPDDITPVELHNSKIARPFEFIGDLYAKPRYGTMDLTRWFAPFYMLFFGFCLADCGYGALITAGGIYLALKGKGGMRAIGTLSIYCGAAAVVFGFFAGSLFGIDIKAWFPGVQKIFFTSNVLFAGALALGVFQILFGMILRAITTARAFGLKYALATIGWITVIVTGLAMMVPPALGLDLGIPKPVFYSVGGAGLFLMLFMNNPGKNLFVNLGGGLWNTYNDITGLLSDSLSYIRLFAIGLSGGVLAAVFNDLAFGLSPDIPVVGQIVTLIILAIGHGLNLFMSTLSSMVHPLRLTFVEFYKNAGFEASPRVFNPLKKSDKL